MLDLQTVQSVINNRYDVMASYARSLKKAYSQEWSRLSSELGQEERHSLSEARRLLPMDEPKLDSQQKATLEQLFQRSEKIRTLYEMRSELRAVWERTNLSREQMLVQLQQWCERAEASGIRMLEEMSLRLRRYA